MSSTGRTSNSVSTARSGSGKHISGHVDCGIIVVTYNSAQHIGNLLDSLSPATGGLRTRCVVVDNSSSDETMSIVRSRNEVTAIEAGGNLGYAGAINLAIAHIGSCSSLLILNPDLVLEPRAVVELFQALDQPEVGIAVPMLLSDDGSLYLSTRREPSVSRALGEALFGARWPRRPGWLSETIRDRHAYQRSRECGVGRRSSLAHLGSLQ